MDLEAIDIQTLIVADILGTITPDEKTQLDKLMIDRPELQALYNEIREDMESENIIAHADGSTSAAELIFKAKRRGRNRYIRSFAAAACSIGLVGGLSYYILTSKQQPASLASWEDGETILLKIGQQEINLEKNVATNVNGIAFHPETGSLTFSSLNSTTHDLGILTVPRGKNNYKVVLDDGSEVLLNNTSRISFPLKFDGSKREISIDGEAYVKVSPKAGQPFIVHLPHNRQVEVLGTEFNINTYDSGIAKISLVQGSVQVAEGESHALLTPGKAATIDAQRIAVNTFDAEEVLGWRDGIIVFPDNVTIEKIAEVVGRNMKVKIIVEKSAAGKKFIGVILDKSKPISHLLQQLTDTKEVTYSISKDGVIHIL
ncbi:FecR domain-containing protein [Chitinophaga sancti]|uniref:FecR domain-containing protein n=1 Tax=Chitinophaga sancti TaxID=1004 RepID=A0A1K1S5W0_9BACT|nr:FecR domain-containing protein [Chitinophaga sancti]WQD62228.1 FecR domain-containing protein [Chitinophaga sancti]WQG92203.1 FecR domain-containing protein [Chitinophaga sancti]SFW79816.1 FecR family protein [Chitinophaga sancti]